MDTSSYIMSSQVPNLGLLTLWFSDDIAIGIPKLQYFAHDRTRSDAGSRLLEIAGYYGLSPSIDHCINTLTALKKNKINSSSTISSPDSC